VLLEEKLFFLINKVHDVIEVTDDHHDIFLSQAQCFFALVELRKVDVQVDQAVLLDLVPVVDLDHDLAQVCVKVALKKSNFARLGKHSVLTQESWLAF